MTTIAWDGKIFAADTLMTEGDLIAGYEPKIYKVGFGYVASAGRSDDGWLFHDWVLAGCDESNKPKMSGEDFNGVLITNEGVVYEYNETLIECPLPSGQYAWGTGGTVAWAAMKKGDNAIDAVKFAIEHTTTSGGEVTHFVVHE